MSNRTPTPNLSILVYSSGRPYVSLCPPPSTRTRSLTSVNFQNLFGFFFLLFPSVLPHRFGFPAAQDLWSSPARTFGCPWTRTTLLGRVVLSGAHLWAPLDPDDPENTHTFIPCANHNWFQKSSPTIPLFRLSPDHSYILRLSPFHHVQCKNCHRHTSSLLVRPVVFR